MSDKPPPFANYLPVSSDDIWKKILSGEVPAFIYSTEARGDFEPVPISAAEIFMADEAGQAGGDEEQVWQGPKLKPHQIMWRDSDRRRPSARRRGIRVPHWVYVMKADTSTQDRGPRAAKPSGVQTNKQAALKGQCSAWIRTLPTRPPRRKSDVKADSLAAIPGLSGRQFDAAWDEAAPPEWKRAGRRSEN
jgi:hypothetical protein